MRQPLSLPRTTADRQGLGLSDIGSRSTGQDPCRYSATFVAPRPPAGGVRRRRSPGSPVRLEVIDFAPAPRVADLPRISTYLAEYGLGYPAEPLGADGRTFGPVRCSVSNREAGGRL
jgi:hypothetical protein